MSLKLGTTNIPGVRVAGSGGQSYTAGTGINITNDVISLDIDAIYPVGSIYIGINNVNPGTIFGGTWVQLEDRFLLGAGSTYTAGDTGGSSSQTVNFSNGRAQIGYNTANSYLHMLANGTRFTPGNSAKTGGNWGANTENTSLSTQLAGSQTLDNMPPYLVVYMWKRTE